MTSDIVLVRLRQQQEGAEFNQTIRVQGTLELGAETDQDTGFVNRVRLVDALCELA